MVVTFARGPRRGHDLAGNWRRAFASRGSVARGILRAPKTMTHDFPIHTLDTAPAAARPALQQLQASIGAIPNLAAAMAESPPLIHAFVTLRQHLEVAGTFAAVERELVSLVNAAENDCRYCTAIHATFGRKAGLSGDDVDRVRSGRAPADARLAALATFARRVLRSRGSVDDRDLAAFVGAGFTRAQALELVARLALSVMANYAGHMTHVRPDESLLPMFE
jgi:uncharacterized peroxidase-related enzyme